MGKFGKNNIVSRNMNDFMIGVMAPSGFGKTTLMYKTCDKLFGDTGYIVCDMGSENGISALDGVVAERVPTWKRFKEIVDDIVKNKDSDYPDLKVIVMDTLDAAFEIAEEYTVKAWNAENMGQQGFKAASSINSVEGGFGKGLDRVIDVVKREINRLDNVGVRVWWTAHVKEKDQTDLFSGNTYTTLTANMSMKYFNSIKNISHIVSFGYFNRVIERQEVGEANIVTKKKKTRDAVLDESRRLKFRDSAMIADAKSRFSTIVDEINLDVDEFIAAITDSIKAEGSDVAPATRVTKKPAKVEPVTVVADEDVEDNQLYDEVTEDVDDAPFDIDDEPSVDELMADIRSKFRTANAETKASVKAVLSSNGATKLDASLGIEVLKEIKAILD